MVFLLPALQIWTSWSNVPMSAPSTCSSTRCCTPSSRAWPTAAIPKRPLIRACVSAAERTAATNLATISTRSAIRAALRCTSKLVKWCLTKVNKYWTTVVTSVWVYVHWGLAGVDLIHSHTQDLVQIGVNGALEQSYVDWENELISRVF